MSAKCKLVIQRPLNNTNFGKEVKRILPDVETIQLYRNGLSVRIYAGIAVREDSEVAELGLTEPPGF